MAIAGDSGSNVVSLTRDQIQRVPSPRVEGLGAAQMLGNSKAPGPYVHRVKFPKGRVVQPHSHPDDRTYTVGAGADQTSPGAPILLHRVTRARGRTCLLPLARRPKTSEACCRYWTDGGDVKETASRLPVSLGVQPPEPHVDLPRPVTHPQDLHGAPRRTEDRAEQGASTMVVQSYSPFPE